jgi:hypothetical protein
MASSILGGAGSVLNQGQAKKTETQTSSSGSSGSTSETGSTTTTGNEPVGGTPETTTQTAVTQGDAGAATGGSTTPAAKSYSSAPAATQVTAMPDRLRELIVEYRNQDAVRLTSLHEVAPQLAAAREPAGAAPLAAEVVQWTKAAIIADATTALRAQATQTQQSARAFLTLN